MNLSEQEKRKYRCCFTGHRPEKLTLPEESIRKQLRPCVLQAIEDGYTTFITGMARGVDLWAGQIVIELREQGYPIKLVAACPHPDFESSWGDYWKDMFHEVLDKADFVQVVCPEFKMSNFQERNEWMVDRSSRVIAVYNGRKGGTHNTIFYARKTGVDVEIID